MNSVPHARVDSQADVSALKPNHLVVMLGSRLFEDRERAAQELFRRKSTAISALADGMSSQIPEIAYRSASIVIRLLDEPDREVAAQARSVVLNVTDHRNPISAQALSLEYRWRSRAVLAEIERFGGKIQRDGKSISLNTSWRGGADGLALFPWIANLEELELCHSAINDAALAQLRGLTHLKSLNLYRSSVTSNGIQHLTSWPNLETLMLQGTPTDDSAIKYLQQLSKLKAINLRDTRLSDLGIERVQQALPKLRILR